MLDVQLEFAEYTPEAFVNAIMPHIAAGARRLRFRPNNDFARYVASILSASCANLRISADSAENEAAPPGVHQDHPDSAVDLTVLCDNDADHLAARLLDYLDSDECRLLAPITRYHSKSRPLFLISIPKSGTHLLYEFAQTLGYNCGFSCPIVADAGTWYFIQNVHSHTRATDFLGETPWHAPFGNRHHPFTRSPALFIYRNPLDILISEANWYQQDGQNIFAGYYSGLSFEERLFKLVDDPWLLGSIRDRMGAFAAWLDMPNVIPIAFEEIVGPRGGGDLGHQLRLIWSLQLKLQVPGTPGDFADKVFNPNSPTFHAGQINAYKRNLTAEAKAKFLTLPQDFMAAYGYDGPDVESPVAIPRHVERFRRRPVTVSAVDPGESPVMLEHGFLEHNLVLYRDRIFALPWAMGPFDLARAEPHQLANLLHGRDLNEIKQKVQYALPYAGGEVDLRFVSQEERYALLQDRDRNILKQKILADHNHPRVVNEKYRDYQIVCFRERYYALPLTLEVVEATLQALIETGSADAPHWFVGASEAECRAFIDDLAAFHWLEQHPVHLPLHQELPDYLKLASEETAGLFDLPAVETWACFRLLWHNLHASLRSHVSSLPAAVLSLNPHNIGTETLLECAQRSSLSQPWSFGASANLVQTQLLGGASASLQIGLTNAQLQAALGNWEAAADLVRKAIEQDELMPGGYTVLLSYLTALSWVRHLFSAEALGTRVAQQAFTFLRDLSLCFLQSPPIQQALVSSLPADDAASRATTHMRLGEALFSAGLVIGAEAAFHTAQALMPESAEVHNNLAVLYWQVAQQNQEREYMQQALVHLERALLLDPTNVDVLVNAQAIGIGAGSDCL